MITVCIMSYKYGHLVAQAIESVLSQTKRPDRIIVVDDGIGDCSFVSKYPVDLIERPQNLGIVENFNQTLNEVDTEKVLFLGADNWLRPDALELIDNCQADIVSTDIALFGTEADSFAEKVGSSEKEQGYRIWRFKQGDINNGNYIHGSSLYNVELAKSVGGYKPSGHTNSEEDWMLWKAMLNSGATHTHVSEPLLYYRRHKDNFQK